MNKLVCTTEQIQSLAHNKKDNNSSRSGELAKNKPRILQYGEKNRFSLWHITKGQ